MVHARKPIFRDWDQHQSQSQKRQVRVDHKKKSNEWQHKKKSNELDLNNKTAEKGKWGS